MMSLWMAAAATGNKREKGGGSTPPLMAGQMKCGIRLYFLKLAPFAGDNINDGSTARTLVQGDDIGIRLIRS